MGLEEQGQQTCGDRQRGERWEEVFRKHISEFIVAEVSNFEESGVVMEIAVLDRSKQVEGRMSRAGAGVALDARDCHWGHIGIPWTDSSGNGGRQWDSDIPVLVQRNIEK